MSRLRNPPLVRLSGSWLAFLLLVTFASPLGAAPVDRVTLRSGERIEGRVISLDERTLRVEVGSRAREFARGEVERIELGEAPPPPIEAKVRVVESDDEVRLFLDGVELAPASQLKAEWFDLAPLLGDGPHHLTAEVINRRGPRAWRWVLEAGGRREVFACGLAGKSGCDRDGSGPFDLGTFPAGGARLYVSHREGRIEVARDPP